MMKRRRHRTIGDRKLALMRRADTERDVKHSISGSERKSHTFGASAPITLPRLKCLEPEEVRDA